MVAHAHINVRRRHHDPRPLKEQYRNYICTAIYFVRLHTIILPTHLDRLVYINYNNIICECHLLVCSEKQDLQTRTGFLEEGSVEVCGVQLWQNMLLQKTGRVLCGD